MIVYHVAITTVDAYLTRREPHRQASFEHLMGLRAHGMMIAAGRAPDGRSCDLFCRVQQPGDIEKLVETNPFFVDGLWTGYAPRSFAQFLEPWELPAPHPLHLKQQCHNRLSSALGHHSPRRRSYQRCGLPFAGHLQCETYVPETPGRTRRPLQ